MQNENDNSWIYYKIVLYFFLADLIFNDVNKNIDYSRL